MAVPVILGGLLSLLPILAACSGPDRPGPLSQPSSSAPAARPPPPAAARSHLARLLDTDDLPGARAYFAARRQREPRATLAEETILNRIGYRLLRLHRLTDAIEVFGMNAEMYPYSSNAHDSLAEAYLAAGNTSAAVRHYRQALRLTPTNDRVIRTLALLGSPVSLEEQAVMLRRIVPRDVELLSNLAYAPGLQLHLLRRNRSAAPAPVLIYIHGGGWSEGTKERGLIPLLDFVRGNYVGVSVQYRLASEAVFPAQLHDLKCAVRFLRANAARLGIDPGRIAVWGNSAGGHLAALLGTTGEIGTLEGPCPWPGSSRPDAVIDWNGPTDLLEPRELARLLAEKAREGAPTIAIERLLGGDVAAHRRLAAEASPITWVSRRAPPFLILHGEADTSVDISQSREFHAALTRAGVDATLRTYPGEGHFGVGFNMPVPPGYRREMELFLDRVFARQRR